MKLMYIVYGSCVVFLLLSVTTTMALWNYVRVIGFSVRGMMEFTKSGYISASKNFKDSDLQTDLSQKFIMITGANSGIGLSAAIELSKRNATIYMVVRNKERGEAARQQIIENSQNNKVELFICDLSVPKEVINFTKEFKKTGKPLTFLCANAGAMINNLEIIDGKYEANFATNTLSNFILIKEFAPLLKVQNDSRVLITSSGGMYTEKLDTGDITAIPDQKGFDGMKIYAQNKRQQVVMAGRFAEEYPSIFFASWHPGWVDTPAVRHSMPDFYRRMKDKLRTPEEGSDTLVWLGCKEGIRENFTSGGFFQDRQEVGKHLTFASTGASQEEEKGFMKKLETIYQIEAKEE